LEVLNQEGFSYLHDHYSACCIHKILNKSTLVERISNITYTSYSLIGYSQNALRSLNEKAIRITNLYSTQMRVTLNILDNLLKNASCFVAQETVWVFWDSFSFYHPWDTNITRLTKQLHENGIAQVSRRMSENFFMISQHNYHKGLQMDSMYNRDENTNISFIEFNEAKPIFVVFIICIFLA